MEPTRRILVTGSSGQVGRGVVSTLVKHGHDVVGFDRSPCRSQDQNCLKPTSFVRANLVDTVALQAAMTGVDAVVHLGAVPDDDPLPGESDSFPSDVDNFVADLVPANVVGTYNVLKAAVRLGVKRVILASSGQVIHGHLTDEHSRVDLESSFAPKYLYACTKVMLEMLGRVYAKQHQLEVLVARLGWCPRPGQDEAFRAYKLAPFVHLSSEDAGEFAHAAVCAPLWPKTQDREGAEFTFGIIYVTSRPYQGNDVYDAKVARDLGYHPKSEWTD